MQDLLTYDWILPPTYFPLRTWFEDLFKRARLTAPKPFLETGSLAILRGTLLKSDCVTVSTRLQCWHDTGDNGVLRVLPVSAVSRACAERPLLLHLARRVNAMLSPAALALHSAVIDVAQAIENGMLDETDQNLPPVSWRSVESAG